MQHLLKSLVILLVILNDSLAEQTITTNNLLEQDFTNWNGNIPIINDPLHTDHVLPGTNNGYSQYTINQSDIGLSNNIINNGFSSTLGADIWFWSQSDQTVEMSQTYNDGNNTIISQSRTITGNCGNQCLVDHNYTNYTDTMIVGSNTATQGNVTVRFDFTDNGYQYGNNYHSGADVHEPTLHLTYQIPDVVMPEPPQPIIIEPILDPILEPIDIVAVPIMPEPQPEEQFNTEEVINAYDPEPVMETPVADEPTAPEPTTDPVDMVVEVEAEIESVVELVEVPVNQSIIDPINIVLGFNIDTAALLATQPSLKTYAAVNQEIFETAELPSGDLNLFNEIKLPGYDRAIYRSRKKMLTMLLNDPVIQYEIKLKQAKSVTDRAYKKLMETISARNNI